MPRPLIAVTAAAEELSTAFGLQDCVKLTTVYTDAVYAAGGRPVVLPVTVDPPADLLARFDGLLLTGGGDLDPELYGERPDPTVYGVRKDRDAFETAVYKEAIERGLPIFAICRGMQLVNVLRGGNLVQRLKTEQNHWQTNPGHEPSHQVTTVAGSRVSEMLGGGTAPVNSYHHQGLSDLGTGLTVTARCGEVIEAIEATDADLVAVQWHPEHMSPYDNRQLALFEAFVARAAARITTNV
ncbi:gamma-glutamyl-gamma-aminobutyrate hydrolase family protein [Streptomyces sp. SID8361]|uniref:gamma-glutamyl-gamma-aminobutyrate hydrolase family protein n=1 Tax=Streptomyces sp. MnatMP-M27 TaxID=1839768 RepID=UPI00081DA979|nr:gamma-glutamyl-gamma-aminobutyrate hydrolase family protein [Streptomyces sp. MnatMP-M27]MYU11090.1 gamma-glutamyl-gamma-aminobutyrate hydrolase family protein [Streptomyces sp. SID8361]SCF78192.1 putative glutamine amidotransferase [Streptomyces sp. MnatMP-M27]